MVELQKSCHCIKSKAKLLPMRSQLQSFSLCGRHLHTQLGWGSPPPDPTFRYTVVRRLSVC